MRESPPRPLPLPVAVGRGSRCRTGADAARGGRTRRRTGGVHQRPRAGLDGGSRHGGAQPDRGPPPPTRPGVVRSRRRPRAQHVVRRESRRDVGGEIEWCRYGRHAAQLPGGVRRGDAASRRSGLHGLSVGFGAAGCPASLCQRFPGAVDRGSGGRRRPSTVRSTRSARRSVHRADRGPARPGGRRWDPGRPGRGDPPLRTRSGRTGAVRPAVTDRRVRRPIERGEGNRRRR